MFLVEHVSRNWKYSLIISKHFRHIFVTLSPRLTWKYESRTKWCWMWNKCKCIRITYLQSNAFEYFYTQCISGVAICGRVLIPNINFMETDGSTQSTLWECNWSSIVWHFKSHEIIIMKQKQTYTVRLGTQTWHQNVIKYRIEFCDSNPNVIWAKSRNIYMVKLMLGRWALGVYCIGIIQYNRMHR